MQIVKIQTAIEASRQFVAKAEEVLSHSKPSGQFLHYDGKDAKILKKFSHRALQALTELRRP
jgi:hypothetical protein